ncbi:MAG TPA: hypothetical protein DDZ51_27220 [Planctomycetaceae bacterium]|nr:hypothetical protein [Planctomycetaceae bacterium]
MRSLLTQVAARWQLLRLALAVLFSLAILAPASRADDAVPDAPPAQEESSPDDAPPKPEPLGDDQPDNEKPDNEKPDNEQPGNEQPQAASPKASASLPQSFETLRPILFFQGQGSGLIPETFRPITISQLDSRLSGEGTGAMSVFEKPQLNRAVYVARLVDSALVSSQTTWEISHGGDSPAILALGRIGLALQSAGLSSTTGAGYRTDAIAVVTQPDGTASVDVQGDTKLTLAWTAAGQESEREIAFDLAFPRSEQARWLVEVPQGMRLQSLDGVSQSLPSPPPEAGNRDSGRGSWYAIEAGGLDRLRLRVLKIATGTGETEVIVRQASFQYDLSPAVMRFSCRLSIDPPSDGVLPPLQISGGRLTSITLGGASVAWNETTATGTRLVRIRQDRAEIASTAPIAITIDGEAAWDTQSDLQPLPWIRLRECVPIVVGNQVQVKVLVDSRLTLLRLETPSAWRYLAAVENDGRRVSYRLGGPWDDAPLMVGAVNDQGQAFAESLLRLSATESRFRATWESSVSLASLGPQPVRLRVDAGWTAETVLLPLSGRAVDLPPDFATRREIVIWPTADELIEGNLKIRVTGSRPFRIEGDWARYPATSFVTFAAGRNRFAALVTPPAGFRWDAEASLQNNRIGLDKLTPTQRQMVDTLPTDSLLLDITQGRIMSLGSRRPAAAFNVSSLMTIALANDSVVETHTIKCESASGELDQIRVEFSASRRADVEWSVNEKATPTRRLMRAKRLKTTVADDPASRPALSPSDSQNGPTIDSGGGLTQPLTASNVGASDMPREIWDLELERSGSRGVVLVGRRESSLAASGGILRLELPSVLGADNRLAQVFIPSTFDVVRTGEGVLKVPRLVGPDLISGGAKFDQQDGVTLRYDSSATNWIEVARADPGKRVAVLWHEAVDIIASGRGGDWVTATYGIDVGSKLLIRHDAELRLASVTDGNGSALSHESLTGQLSIPLDASTNTLVIRWSRPADAFEPARKWSPPRIAPVAVVLRRDWRLTAAPDTWIPNSLAGAFGFGPRNWFGDRAAEKPQFAPLSDSLASVSESSVRIEPATPQSIWLVDRSTALCSIAILGFVLFSAAWMLVGNHAVVVGTAFIVSVFLIPGIPAGWIHWIAAVCVPIAAGGLVGSTRAAIRRDRIKNDLSHHQQNKSGSSARLRLFDVTPTTERLVARLLALLIPIAGSSAAYGQPLANRPIVLVPTKTDGSLAGDKVYISQTFFNELFREKSISVAPPLITSAVYRLRLDAMTESGMPTADWEIRYSLANLAERSEIYLPFKPSQVRNVQWLPGGEAKPLRWTAEGDSRIRVSLPPTSSAAMLVRLSTDVQSPERLLRRIQLTIPPVTAASLVVDSGTAVQRFETSGAIGQTTLQPESGRLSSDLGPTSSIDLTVTLRQGARGIPAIAARRYWIHASGDRCQVECEIDPGTESLRRGTDLPIVILGGQPAILTSRDWSIHSSEMISPQRQLLTCRSRRDSAGPIRLMWNLDVPIANDEATAQAAAFQVPDVISAGSAATPDAVMAIQSGDGYRIVSIGLPPDTASQSPNAIDAFVAQWTGFRHTASQVIRSPSPLVRFAIIPNQSQPWTSDERHHLHVRQGEMRLTLDATIKRGAQAIGPLRLAYPKRLEIRELTINGVAVSVSPHSIAGRSEVAIPEQIGGEKLNVRVVAHQRLGTDEAFSPPRIRIVPIRSIDGTYTFTRDQGLRVEQIRATSLPELAAPALDIADQLLSGYFPCWTWQLSEATADQLPSPDPQILLDGLFRAEQRASRVDSVQRTAIRWTQSRWMLDVLIQVRARGPEGTSPSLLDDLNIELPTAWSDQLMVEPAQAWSSQPAIDPAMKVIRIRPDAQSRAAGVATLRLQAFRIGEADSLLEVPTVRVMGTASTQTFMSVPQTASGRPLIWQTQSAAVESLPAGLENDEAAAAGELVFRALSNRATIRLQPSRPDVTMASATLCDVQLFPQPDLNWLAIVRWDVEPGDSRTIPIEVPFGGVPLAVWASGRTVPLTDTASGSLTADASPAENNTKLVSQTATRLDVPMSLSQLAQPIVMLCQLRSPDPRTPPALPTLADVDVNETWLTLYKSSDGSGQSAQIVLPNDLPQGGANPDANNNDGGTSPEQSRWIASSDGDRLIALAQSVIDVTESSISGATDRPQEELIAWLTAWDQRFLQLRAEAAGSTNDPSAAFGLRDWVATNPLTLLDGSQSTTDPAVMTSLLETEPSPPIGPWRPLVDRWGEYVRRVTGIEMVQDASEPPAMMPSDRWTVATVAKHKGVATTIPVIRNGGEVSTLMLAIHLLIAGSFIVGGGLLAWIFRKSLAKPLAQPAVWLLAVGLASLAVTPIPVAIAICVVAITAPLLNAPPNGNGANTRLTRSRTQPKPIARV